MTHDEELLRAQMNDIIRILPDADGVIHPHIAVPALLYTTGYILFHSLREGEQLPVILAKCVEDILYGIQTSETSQLTVNAINKAKGD